MKNSQVNKKISPNKFAAARDSIRIVKPTTNHKMLEFRNNINYNSDKINNYVAKIVKNK